MRPHPRQGEAIAASSSDAFVSWLPLHHDMGLIAAWLDWRWIARSHCAGSAASDALGGAQLRV
jgi:hypothetical protein